MWKTEFPLYRRILFVSLLLSLLPACSEPTVSPPYVEGPRLSLPQPDAPATDTVQPSAIASPPTPSPLPTVGQLTSSKATGPLPGPVVGVDAEGRLCVAYSSMNGAGYLGYTRYDAAGAKAGSVPFTVIPEGASSMIMETSGRVWAVTPTQVMTYGADGKLIGAYPFPNQAGRALAFDPAGNLWLQSGPSQVTRLAPSGIILGTPAVAADAPLQLDRHHLAFDATSDEGWALAGSQLLKFSSTGSHVLVVNFPPTPSAEQPLTALTVDAAGHVWVARQDGQLFQVGADGKLLGRLEAATDIRWLFTDARGDVWAISPDGQVTLYTPAGLAVGRQDLGFAPEAVERSADGTLWFLRKPDDTTPPLPSFVWLTSSAPIE